MIPLRILAVMACLPLSFADACMSYRVNGSTVYMSYDGRQCTDGSCCRVPPVAAQAPRPDRFLDSSSIINRLDKLITRQPFARLPNSPFDDLIRQEASRNGLDPLLLKSVIRVESNFDPYAVSKKGAGGLMQLMPDTARHFGARNRFDPEDNIRAGARFLRVLMNKLQDLDLALAAYNAGETAVRRYGGIPPYRETQRYVRVVKGIYSRARAERGDNS